MKTHKVSKVVDASNLEWATRDGWSLVFTGTQSDVVHVGYRPATAEERNFGQYSNVELKEVGTRLAFVVEKDAELISKEDAAQARAAEAEAKLREVQKTSESQAEKIAVLEAESATHKKSCEHWMKQHSESEAKNRRLEADIGKIRQAVGGIRMKEILGG